MWFFFTLARIWSFNALSTLLCRPKREVYFSNFYRMATLSIPVVLGRYTGAAPGFSWEANEVAKRVAYTAGVTVCDRSPRPPHQFFLYGGGITIDFIEEFGKIFVVTGSNDRGNG